MSLLRDRSLFFVSSFTLWFLTTVLPTNANPVGDSTLPTPSALGCIGNNCTINGGTQLGNNLFHSFSQFSVPTGGVAYFNNNPTTVNIISRVTGGSVSNIDGLLKSNGTANLFLINPAGLVFGANAQLNIGGSFLGSTASSLKFADGNEFSATNSPTASVLTVSVPIGLQFGQTPAAISVQGTGHNLSIPEPITGIIARTSSLTGLQVPTGKTIALVGGDINIDGGVITAPDGRIELGSISNGLVSLNSTDQGWTLVYAGASSFQDIRLSQVAAADASGNSGGAISVRGRNVSVSDGSVILIQNQGSQPSGNLTIDASGTVEVTGATPDARISSSLINESLGMGSGGNLEINARRLLIQDGGQIATINLGTAKAGNVSINAADSVEIIGFTPLNPSFFSRIGSPTFNSGSAGNVFVSTRQLRLVDGGVISSSTFGTAAGGEITINATESVELTGAIPIIFVPSSITTASFNAGNAGNLTINTSTLVLRDGPTINATTFASGDAGSVTINARESVEISGQVGGLKNFTTLASSATITNTTTQELFKLPPVPSGSSGNVIINTDRLSVSNGGAITTVNEGAGKAGSVQINAGYLVVDNQGTINAATASGEGGNIDLRVQNLLVMRYNSLISATAGGTGNGGNITINAPFVTGVQTENSDIIANAFQGKGGNINITTSGIFGLQFRPQLTPKSDITASSDFGVNGTVQINTLNIDPSQELTSLPTQFANVEVVKDSCQAAKEPTKNLFIVTGRGGLPPSPNEPLNSDVLFIDWAMLPQENREKSDFITQNLPSISTLESPLVEAQGWMENKKGEIILTVKPPEITAHSLWQIASACTSYSNRQGG